MTHSRVICLGEILYDCLAVQPGDSVAAVQDWRYEPGGAPANVACALARLGTPAAFIGAMGRDRLGADLLSLCQQRGVDCSGIQYHATAPTRQVYVLRSPSGEPTFAGFGGRAPGEFADAQLAAAQLPQQLFLQADYLVLGTLLLAYPQSRAAVHHALELAENYRLKVVLDVNWRPVFWPDPSLAPGLIQSLWESVDFLKLSVAEAQWLFGTTDPGAIAAQLDHLEGVLVTAGGDAPVRYCLSDNEGCVPPFPVAVQDTTGAGDAFLAGFVHQLNQHQLADFLDPDCARTAVTYATAVGSLTTTQLGAIAAQPTAEAAIALLASQS
ncbi:MAG: carbohydrate kinase [Spirulinaceae cyanobacterium SM2_1_0]|nr:carbohydrate kinase [Spirulinaceae cyanobacterium SM2_1_0]